MPSDGRELIAYTVERLGSQHDREAFDCGIPALNQYLKKQAHQEAMRGVSTPYVMVTASAPGEIVGFYTLSSTAVVLSGLPDAIVRKLPRYPLVPATLVGRLAVHTGSRGQGLGERLLVDAVKRSLDASRRVASVAVFVDAKDETAARFYERYGFKRLPSQPRRLFMPMKTVARLWPER
jgi:GNAT superfamily N-acetyltransferase